MEDLAASRTALAGGALPNLAARLGHSGHLSYDPFMSSTAPDTVNDEKRSLQAGDSNRRRIVQEGGFRAVTMELVAREANVPKRLSTATSKTRTAVLGGVCAHGAHSAKLVEQALMKPDAPLDERLAEAVVAKHRPVFTLVRGSPHAAELSLQPQHGVRDLRQSRY